MNQKIQSTIKRYCKDCSIELDPPCYKSGKPKYRCTKCATIYVRERNRITLTGKKAFCTVCKVELKDPLTPSGGRQTRCPKCRKIRVKRQAKLPSNGPRFCQTCNAELKPPRYKCGAFRYFCKECYRAYEKERRIARRLTRDPNKLRVCPKCKVEINPPCWPSGDIKKYCDDCRNAYMKEYRSKSYVKVMYKLSNEKWRLKNPEKVAEYNEERKLKLRKRYAEDLEFRQQTLARVKAYRIKMSIPPVYTLCQVCGIDKEESTEFECKDCRMARLRSKWITHEINFDTNDLEGFY